MFDTLLIANRGEIACRIARTARRMGLRTVAVYSDADRDALHVHACDTAVRIGPPEAARSYLDAAAIVAAARASGAQAIHPGYGFLSESLALIEACEAAGIAFVGPSREAIRRMGSKIESKRIALAAGVPVVPGYHGDAQDEATLVEAAAAIGYPVLIKASAGGGGKGMRVVRNPAEFAQALATVRREALAAFGDDRVLLERYLTLPRHLEVQLLGDKHGHLVHLFERECSIQRNHQKVIEEAPAPHLEPALRDALLQHALTMGSAIGYDSTGTIEFIHDSHSGESFFLEMNTRLQVEHPVTELTVGIDLVEWQLRVAAGEVLAFTQADIAQSGCAIEARVCAESPAAGFAPEIGRLIRYEEPCGPGIRVDSGVRTDSEVSLFYDSMLAKVIAHAADRAGAARRLVHALERTVVQGVHSNLEFLADLVRHPHFAQVLSTNYIANAFPQGWAPRPESELMRVAAALHGVLVRQATASPSPWQTLGAWRLPTAARPEGTRVLLQDAAGQTLGVCRTLGVESESVPQRGQFLPDSQPHSGAMGQEDGKNWAAAARSQPTIPKSDGLLEAQVWPEGAHWCVRFDRAEAAEAVKKPPGEGDGEDRGAGEGGTTWRVQARLAPDALELRSDDAFVRYAVAQQKGEQGEQLLWLTAEGTTRAWHCVDRWQRALRGAAGQHEHSGSHLRAPMPGMVTQVPVQLGTQVQAGEVLVQMEAMKMVHTLSAPAPGRVAELRCRAGDAVRGGDVLVVLETTEENP